MWYLHWRLWTETVTGGYDWVFPAALGMLALLYAARRWRLSIIYVIPGLLLWPLLMATLVGGNPAFLLSPTHADALGMALLFFGGVLVLVRSRERLVWVLAGMVLLVHLPILHLQGPHYLYWPAAFWGLLDATLCWQAMRQWRKLGPRAVSA